MGRPLDARPERDTEKTDAQTMGEARLPVEEGVIRGNVRMECASAVVDVAKK